MKEVVALENSLRIYIPLAIAAKADPMVVSDAQTIMAGKPTVVTGTRLDRLRYLSKALEPYRKP